MKNVFVNHSLNYLKVNNVCDSKQEKIFKYTLETLYSFITKSFGILLLSYILGTFKISLTMMVLYSLLRGFSFGIHATKNIYCWIVSLSVYALFPFLISQYDFSLYLIYSLFIFGVLANLLWSPSDTKARPLINKRKRITNKCISLLISIIYIISAILINNQNLKEIISIILLLNLICTCPLTYYLFNQPYNNYRFYKNV